MKIIIIISLLSILFPQSIIRSLFIPVSISSDSKIGYDTNFLKLSERDIKYGETYPELIGGSNSTSSIVAKEFFLLSFKPFLFNYDTKLDLSIQSSIYLALDEKNYNTYNCKLSQNFGKYKWLRFKYTYTPYNYLREYYDRDNSQIYYVEDLPFSLGLRDSAATYGREKITLEISYPIKNIRSTWFTLSLSNESQYYNKHFTEYDLDIMHYMIGFSWRYSRYIRIESRATFSFADNIGMKDELNSTFFQDRGYNQKIFWASWKRKNIKSIINSFGISQNIVFRNYSSEFPLYDILHYKRSHVDWTSSIWMNKKINNYFSIKTIVNYRSKDTDSNYAELLKTFNKLELFLSIKYKINL